MASDRVVNARPLRGNGVRGPDSGQEAADAVVRSGTRRTTAWIARPRVHSRCLRHLFPSTPNPAGGVPGNGMGNQFESRRPGRQNQRPGGLALPRRCHFALDGARHGRRAAASNVRARSVGCGPARSPAWCRMHRRIGVGAL